ncbi:MAG: hypothetical protein S4CHLAM6_06470 [Chlamydiae bacterium]|nr:hypothetical protein [Chlamydiota bacterium]
MNLKEKFVKILICLTFSVCLHTVDHDTTQLSKVEEYLNFIEVYSDSLGPAGDHTKGEIEIVKDIDKIRAIQNEHQKSLLKRGLSQEEAESWSQVGIIEGDANWIWIRDAVILPSGRRTIKGRLNWKTSLDGPQGVATLAILKNRNIVVCLKYKHAMRSWQIELPRGRRHFGESAVEASKRELRNETGFIAKSQLFLGSVAASSSNFNTLTPIFLSHVKDHVEPENTDDRAILGFLILSKKELKEALLVGHLNLKIHNKVQKVAVNDANLSFALMQAEMRNLI